MHECMNVYVYVSMYVCIYLCSCFYEITRILRWICFDKVNFLPRNMESRNMDEVTMMRKNLLFHKKEIGNSFWTSSLSYKHTRCYFKRKNTWKHVTHVSVRTQRRDTREVFYFFNNSFKFELIIALKYQSTLYQWFYDPVY